MDKCREEFENFCKLNLFVRLDVDGDGNFTSRETKYKFRLWCLAWKASRESMKAIKLPQYKNSNCFTARRHNQTVDEIKKTNHISRI